MDFTKVHQVLDEVAKFLHDVTDRVETEFKARVESAETKDEPDTTTAQDVTVAEANQPIAVGDENATQPADSGTATPAAS